MPHDLAGLDRAIAAVLGGRIAKATSPRPEPQYRAIHRVADAKVKRWSRDFLEAVKATKDEILLEDLQAALKAGNAAAVEAAIPWEKFEQVLIGSWRMRLRDLVAQAAEASAVTLERPVLVEVVSIPPADLPPLPVMAPPGTPSSGKVKLRFNLLNPKAVIAVENHAAELVAEVSTGTKMAIRGLIQEAFLEGWPPAKSARRIRDHIGLLDRYALAADRFRDRQAKLIAKANPALTSREVAGKADALADRYRGKLLNLRAETIARTETLRGSNMGQQLLWGQAQEQGLLDPGRMRRKWIITPDDRLCELCRQMRGERAYADMDEPFDFPTGPVMTPPGHPNCRCAVGLARASKE